MLLLVQWLLDVLGDPGMTDQDVHTALAALLTGDADSGIAAATAAAGVAVAAAAAEGRAPTRGAVAPVPSAAGHLQQLLSVEWRLREMFVQLQPSREAKLQLRELMQQLVVLPPGDERVQRLLADCQALEQVLQDPGRRARAQDCFQRLLQYD